MSTTSDRNDAARNALRVAVERVQESRADGGGEPPTPPPTAPEDEGLRAYTGVIVAAVGLLVLLGIVAMAIFALPSGTTKGQDVVTLSTAAFGVIGAVTGAYFGVHAANRAVTKLERAHRSVASGRGSGI